MRKHTLYIYFYLFTLKYILKPLDLQKQLKIFLDNNHCDSDSDVLMV